MSFNINGIIDESLLATESEGAVLGCIMYNNAYYYEISDLINENMFYLEKNKIIFQSFKEIIDNDEQADEEAIRQNLTQKGLLEKAGGNIYIYEIVDFYPSSGNIKAYANEVLDKHIKRQTLNIAIDLASSCRDVKKKGTVIIEELERTVSKMEGTSKTGLISFKDGAPRIYERLEKISENYGEISGVTFGNEELDKMTGGMQPGQLIVLAGRPGSGKSAKALNLVKQASEKGAILIFSMEMSIEENIMRLIAINGKVDSDNFKNGNLNQDDWDKISMVIDDLSAREIYIDDNPSYNILQIKASIKRKNTELEKAGKPRVLVVILDYLQLVQKTDRRMSIYESVTEVVTECRKTAKKENITFIALSQLNRELEKRANKRPICADLRESGAIEQESNLILFVYRDEIYNEDSKDKGIAEIIIGKQRDGVLGTVKERFIGKYYKFTSLSNYGYY